MAGGGYFGLNKAMPCFVHIIGSSDRTYCGWTTDLDKRLKAHNNGTGAKLRIPMKAATDSG